MSWPEYFEKIKGRPIRPLLKKALEIVPPDYPKIAIDLGCGIGTDTFHLLTNGWTVSAIEKEVDGINHLKSQLSPEFESKLSIQAVAFEALRELPKASLVYASLSLPFCRSECFPQFWKVIEYSFDDRCIFAANFFGFEDDWVLQEKCAGHSEQDIRDLLKDFETLEIHEKKEPGVTALGVEKHWHVFSVLAKR